MSQRFSLNVNGKNHNVDVDPDMPLLYALRNDVGLNNPHLGCGLSQCGACEGSQLRRYFYERDSLEQCGSAFLGSNARYWNMRLSKHSKKTAGTVVMKSGTMAAAAIIGLVVSGANGFAAEKFQKLSGAQIRMKFVGMEMTDNVHWADVFGQNGNLRSYSMGRKKDGKWWIEKDELCVDRGEDDGGCYQVWLSGKNVEFRREGLPAAFEGVLQRPVPRN